MLFTWSFRSGIIGNAVAELTPLRHTQHQAIFTARCYASAVLAMGLCPFMSVSMSVTSLCSIETAERIELVFGVWASFHPSYTVLKGNSLSPKIWVLNSLWNFVLNSGLRKFRLGISIVETCYQLSSRKVDSQSVINWAVVGQRSRWYLRAPTLEHYSLSHRSSSAVYSTILLNGSISDSWYLVEDLYK